jgi:2-polyprenyl-3-methyl-5-hydroxy-6-metoxy-1,4-benzoquinol methylase
MDYKIDWPRETSLALKTRLQFVHNALLRVKAKNILDMGCGTGEHLTQYVARLFPASGVYGVDSDEESIEFARKSLGLQNLHFSVAIPEDILFDSIIASEVIEHVENPYDFLVRLRSKLGDDGVLILTVPNGYGCSELMSLTECLLYLSNTLKVLRRIKSALKPNQNSKENGQDTLAISPHINFFTFKRLTRLFSECGFDQVAYQGRMFLHNFIFSMLIDKSESISKINASLGKALPAFVVSDWMFILKKNKRSGFSKIKVYQRNTCEKIRQYLNNKRYDLT